MDFLNSKGFHLATVLFVSGLGMLIISVLFLLIITLRDILSMRAQSYVRGMIQHEFNAMLKDARNRKLLKEFEDYKKFGDVNSE